MGKHRRLEFQPNDVVGLMLVRIAGKRHNGTEAIAMREPRRNDNGGASLDHLGSPEATQAIVAEKNRPHSDWKFDPHSRQLARVAGTYNLHWAG